MTTNKENTYSDEIGNFLNEMSCICKKVELDENYLDCDQVSKLRQSVQTLNIALKEENTKNRLLRVGIIGSVKAGKSTFLNALLFGGETILPKAATPMTASLTRLRHTTKQQFARFVYYSREDWNEIEREALQAENEINNKIEMEREKHRDDPSFFDVDVYRTQLISQLSEERRACCELHNDAKSKIHDLDNLLDEKEQVVDIDDIKDVASILKKHIGSSGEFTSVVRHVELNINCEMLYDLEIVDTPGLNDPVVSRSQETLKSLAQCDSVFLLSRASAFLPEADLQLLKGKTLYQEGINHKVVVASQMDSAVLDHNPNKETFPMAYKKSGKTVINRQQKADPGLKERPIPISALLASCAHKKRNDLPFDVTEQHVLDRLANYKDAPETPEDLLKYSNIKAIHKALANTRSEKNEIKRRRQVDLIIGRRDRFCDTLLTLEKTAVSNSRLLQEQDLDSLKTQEEQIKKGINGINSKLSSLFMGTNTEMRGQISVLKNRVIEDISNYEDLKVTQNRYEEDRSYQTGIIFKDTHYRTVEITENIATVADAISLLRDYKATAVKHINRTFNEILPIEQLKDKVKTQVLNLYNSIGINFEEDTILLPLEATLGKLTVPRFEFDNDSFNDELINSFSADGTVKNSDINRLKLQLEQFLQKCGKQLGDELEKHQVIISQELEKQSIHFSRNIISETEKQLDTVRSLMADRENNLVKYQEVIANLQSYRELILSYEVENV
jgi:hypothetical protein